MLLTYLGLGLSLDGNTFFEVNGNSLKISNVPYRSIGQSHHNTWRRAKGRILLIQLSTVDLSSVQVRLSFSSLPRPRNRDMILGEDTYIYFKAGKLFANKVARRDISASRDI